MNPFKRIILILALIPLIFSGANLADEGEPMQVSLLGEEKTMWCSMYHAATNYRELKEHPNDKYAHCSLSCIVAVHCPSHEAAILGIVKEVIDVFGPGDASWNDLEADLYGISIATLRMVNSDEGCKRTCDEVYGWHD